MNCIFCHKKFNYYYSDCTDCCNEDVNVYYEIDSDTDEILTVSFISEDLEGHYNRIEIDVVNESTFILIGSIGQRIEKSNMIFITPSSFKEKIHQYMMFS